MLSQSQEATTYLSLIKEDPNQIQSILDDIYGDCLESYDDDWISKESKKKYIEDSKLVKKHFEKQYFEMCRIFMFGQVNYKPIVAYIEQQGQGGNGSGLACAKAIEIGEPAWECIDCAKHDTCIICQECYAKGNHEGHRTRINKSVDGCCDCGDPDSWKESGFCSDHQGYEGGIQNLISKMPELMQKSTKQVALNVCKNIKQQILDELGNADPDTDKFNPVVKSLFNFIKWCIELSPVFVHFFKEAAIQSENLKDIEIPDNHKCCFKPQLDSLVEEQKQTKKNCRCNIMDLAFQADAILDDKTINKISQVFIKLSMSNDFRQHMAYAYFSNYDKIVFMEDGVEPIAEKSTIDLNVQFLTLDHIAINVMQQEAYRNELLRIFEKIVDKLVKGFHVSDMDFQFVLGDLKFMTLPQTTDYLLHETDFIERFMAIITKFYNKNIIEFQTQHVQYEDEVLNEYLMNADQAILSYLKAVFSKLNPNDQETNAKFMSCFIKLLTQISQDFVCDGKKGNYLVPLHRAFAFYFIRLVMASYLQEINKQEDKPMSFYQQSTLLKQIARQLLSGNKELSDQELNDLIVRLLMPLTTSWVFSHEIVSRKWVMSGEEINDITQNLYDKKNDYLYMFIGIFQIMLAASPNPSEIIDATLQNWTKDQILSIFNQQIKVNKILKVEDFEVQLFFDDKKFRSILHHMLTFFIKLSVTEISWIYPLIYKSKGQKMFANDDQDSSEESGDDSDDSRDSDDYGSSDDQDEEDSSSSDDDGEDSSDSNEGQSVDDNCNDEGKYEGSQYIRLAKDMFKQDMRREIVHRLIQLGGKGQMKQIKQNSYKTYVLSNAFEEILLEVSEQIRTQQSNSGVIFNLKEEYYQWFEPYFYQELEGQSQVLEPIKNVKQLQNNELTILGDYKNSYSYQSILNRLVGQSLAESDLLTIVLNLLYNWHYYTLNPAAKTQLIDAQIGHDCLKLLIIILKSFPQMSKKQEHILAKINTGIDEFREVLKWLQRQSLEMKKAVEAIIQTIYELDHKIGSQLQKALESKEDEEEKEEKQETLQTSSTEDPLKALARKRREEIMAKFSSKRQNFMTTKVLEERSLKEPTQEQEEEKKSYEVQPELKRLSSSQDIECALCREKLLSSDFFKNPYGQFAYIQKNMLLIQSIRQTFEQEMTKMNEISEEKEEFVKQHDIYFQNNKDYISQQLPIYQSSLEKLELNCLHEHELTGGTMIKCKHYSHRSCLQDYLSANEDDSDKEEEMKILGLDSETFQCPLCKHIANVLFPSNDFTNLSGDINNLIQNEDLRDIYTELMSQILKNQELKMEETTAVEIWKNPLEVLIGVQKFIENRIQLIDLKGINEFLLNNKQGNGINEYSNLLTITKNMISILNATSTGLQKHQTLDEICDGQIKSIFNNTKDKDFFDLNLSSIAIQLLFYQFIRSKSNEEFMQITRTIISSTLKGLSVQAFVRLVFANNSASLQGSEASLRKIMNIDFIQDRMKNAQIHNSMVKSMISSIRKVFAFVAMINHKQAQENQTIMRDIVEEKDYVKQYQKMLQIMKIDVPDFNKEEDTSTLQLQAILELIGSTQSLRKQLDRFVQSGIKDGQNNNSITLVIPAQLCLLKATYSFSLIELPTHFQTMMHHYIHKKCKNCDSHPNESCVCLLCGDIVCFLQDCCKKLDGMKPKEGELTFHARTCEGGIGLYINTHTGAIYMIEGLRSSKRPSPYVNKYGENYSSKHKKWEHFYLDQQFGGLEIYDKYRQMYVSFTICNEILMDRSKKTSYLRAGRI